MLQEFRPAIILMLAFTLLTGFAYPLVITGIAQVVFPYQAGGSLVTTGGRTVGSALLGQNFTEDKYFHGRPSAIVGPDPKDPSKTVADPYDAASSMGSNLGPTSKAWLDRVTADVGKLKVDGRGEVPVDLVTTSASGLDPDITPAAAIYQVPRVAKARGLDAATVAALVDRQTQGRVLGILGEPHVNVLALNLALDALAKK